MFDLLASIPLSPARPLSTTSTPTPDIFTLAIHPKLPIYSIGLSTGHVQTFRLPSVSNTPLCSTSKSPIKGHNAPPNSRTTSHNETSQEETNGSSQPRRSSLTDTGHSGGAVELLWKTKRHKGSCRALAFSVDGKYLISAGSEGIVKAASTETGKVISKIAVPQVRAGVDAPTVIRSLSLTQLAIATDSGALHLYDLSLSNTSFLSNTPALTMSSAPIHTYHPHISIATDSSNLSHISSITPLTPSAASTSKLPKLIFTAGGTTISVTDAVTKKVRFNSVSKDDDFSEAEDLLSSVYIPLADSDAGVVAVGDGSCNISFYERGQWKVPLLKENLGGDDTIDALCLLPDSVGKRNKMNRLLAAGCGDGRIVFIGVDIVPELHKITGKRSIKYVKVRVENDLNHDDENVEGVVGIGWVRDPDSDTSGRMISVGGNVVRIWGERDSAESAADGYADLSSDSASEGAFDELNVPDSDSDSEPKVKGLQDTKLTPLTPVNGDGLPSEEEKEAESDSGSDINSDSEAEGKKRRKKRKGKQGKKAKSSSGNGSGLSVKLKGL